MSELEKGLIEGLTELRDTLKAGIPLGDKYTIRLVPRAPEPAPAPPKLPEVHLLWSEGSRNVQAYIVDEAGKQYSVEWRHITVDARDLTVQRTIDPNVMTPDELLEKGYQVMGTISGGKQEWTVHRRLEGFAWETVGMGAPHPTHAAALEAATALARGESNA